MNIFPEIITHIASYVKSPTLKLLSRELNEEITKEENSDEWRQKYNNKLKMLTNLPALKASSKNSWKYEYYRIGLDGYFVDFKNVDIGKSRELCIDSQPSIKRIPHKLGYLINLNRLELDNNSIREIELFNCPNIFAHLVNLNVGWNLIEYIPIGLCNMLNLQNLCMHHNKIVDIPNEIGNLKNLELLSLCGNCISAIPTKICDLIKLRYLGLTKNKIRIIPIEIEKLIMLERLLLGMNLIKYIPIELSNLLNLRELDLDENQIICLPKELSVLVNLRNLYLYGNMIEKIPKELCKLENCKISIDIHILLDMHRD